MPTAGEGPSSPTLGGMGKGITIGRRRNSIDELELGGDYFLGGSVIDDQGERPALWFLLPMARDEDVTDHRLRAVHRVTSPPWTFRECEDGSVEVRASIGILPGPSDPEPEGRFVWHGFLDEGHRWREV